MNIKSKIFHTGLFSVLLVALSSASQAQVDPIDPNSLALGGYDVVSYFKDNKPIRGTKTYTSIVRGVTYYFSSKQNLDDFQQHPDKYLPQYDGFCALGVSYGKKLSIDPETYKIIDNKLYFFFNGQTSKTKINSVEIWNRNEAKLLKKAENLWPSVKKKAYDRSDSL